MEYIKENKGVIIFYLLLIISTLVIINCNERHLSVENNYSIYLQR